MIVLASCFQVLAHSCHAAHYRYSFGKRLGMATMDLNRWCFWMFPQQRLLVRAGFPVAGIPQHFRYGRGIERGCLKDERLA